VKDTKKGKKTKDLFNPAFEKGVESVERRE
jgi:hypothetical protein